ncbi:DMT family transporter [Bacillus sp. FJAT-45066]|uniref:DMT family transporter n=1 Tax=Bacillus sp. FJAT-45066 TaxID=2011010 RepID=UPI000BB9B4E8|nr:EamA family transporter [Bacillus sp. FJAT-45066]
MGRLGAVLLVLIAAVLWGTTGTAQTFAPSTANPIAIGAVRLAIGGGLLLLIVIVQKKWNVDGISKRLVLLSAISMAAFQPFFFSSVKLTGIAVGTVLAIGSAPVFAGCIEWLIKKKAPSFNWWLATIIAISGCILLFSSREALHTDSLGMILAISAGFAFALYTFSSKQLLHSNNPETVVAIVFTTSAVLLSPAVFFFDMRWFTEVSGMTTVIYLGVFTTAIAYLCFSKGLEKVPASTAVTLTLAEPLTAALLGTFIVREALSPLSWLGVLLIFLAIIVLSSPTRKRHREVKAF